MQRVLHAFPPLYREINKAFNVRGRPVIFSFGPVIYNPSRIAISPELLVHEGVHAERQGEDAESWWLDYIAKPEFRLAEEMPAHIAEYADVCRRIPPCKARSSALHRIAARLSSPLYGSMITYDDARWNIYGAVEAMGVDAAPPL